MKIISSSYSKNLTFSICKYLNLSPLKIEIKQFSSGEYLVTVPHTINEDEDVVIIGSMAPSTNDSLMEILAIADAAVSAGGKNLTLVSPYLGFSRQDSRIAPYSSLGIGILAKLLKVSRINRLITVDLHSVESLKLFTIPVVNISAMEIFAHYIQNISSNITLVAPDCGSAVRLKDIGQNVVTIRKIRAKGKIYMELDGNVQGQDCFIIDDIFDSGNTMTAAMRCLKNCGAKSVIGYVTHFLSTKPSRIPLYITDSVDVNAAHNNFIEVFSLAPIISRVLTK